MGKVILSAEQVSGARGKPVMDHATEIANSLSPDELRMVFAGKVDSGGEGSQWWSSTFSNDSRIWQMTSANPEPHLTRLGLSVYYAIISDKDLMARIKDTQPMIDTKALIERLQFLRSQPNSMRSNDDVDDAMECAEEALRDLTAENERLDAECERWIKSYKIAHNQAMDNGSAAARLKGLVKEVVEYYDELRRYIYDKTPERREYVIQKRKTTLAKIKEATDAG